MFCENSFKRMSKCFFRIPSSSWPTNKDQDGKLKQFHCDGVLSHYLYALLQAINISTTTIFMFRSTLRLRLLNAKAKILIFFHFVQTHYKLYDKNYLQNYSATTTTTTTTTLINATINECLDTRRYYRTCRRDGPNPYYGSVSFDNFAMAFVFIYQVMF